MKPASLIPTVVLLVALVPNFSLAEAPLVPCDEGYTYTCDEYNICSCQSNTGGDSEILSINYTKVESEAVLGSSFFFTLLANEYSEGDAVYIVEIVNAYFTKEGSVSLDKAFKRYLRKNGLNREEVGFVVNSLSILFEGKNVTRYFEYELEPVIITSYQIGG